MKVAIYSGVIPTATFIEHVIKGVSRTHNVFLFGTLNKSLFKPYQSKNIQIYQTEENVYKQVWRTGYRLFLLTIKHPKRLRCLFLEVYKYKTVYQKWDYFSKFLPIILYKPDVLHIQWAKEIKSFGFMQEAYGIKIVLSFLGSHINYSPIVDKDLAKAYCKWFPKIGAFHAVSEAIKLEAQNYDAQENKIKVIRSPIPDLFFNAYQTFTKRKPTNHIKLVSVGRFHWVKGMIYAIRAVAILKQRGFIVEYTIIGRKDIPEEILYEMHSLGVRENITIRGNMEQQEVIELLFEHDVLILPSIMEGIANVVLEAMAIGLPVISTDCGGMNEVVKMGETGWLIPKRSEIAIADAVVNVIATSEDGLQLITHNAHVFVKQYYSANNSINEFIQLYQDVLTSDC